MKRFLMVALGAFVAQSALAFDLVLSDQLMDMDDPMFDRVDESGVLDPNGQQVNYQVLDFYVTASGTYDLEMAVKSSNDTRDTYILLYDTAMNPGDATQNFLAGNDDNSDPLTVLSGSYQMGSSGRSRIDQFSLIADHQYQVVFTTFDFSATFFQDMIYDAGIGNGSGDVIQGSPVPEPGTLFVLGSAAMVFAARRRRRQK